MLAHTLRMTLPSPPTAGCPPESLIIETIPSGRFATDGNPFHAASRNDVMLDIHDPEKCRA